MEACKVHLHLQVRQSLERCPMQEDTSTVYQPTVHCKLHSSTITLLSSLLSSTSALCTPSSPRQCPPTNVARREVPRALRFGLSPKLLQGSLGLPQELHSFTSFRFRRQVHAWRQMRRFMVLGQRPVRPLRVQQWQSTAKLR